MIAADTNVVVRFLTADDPSQAKRSRALFRNNEVWLSRTVILETEWVLRGAFQFDREIVNNALASLISMEGVEVEDHLVISEAIELHSNGWDFADALHVLICPPETQSFFSFDKSLTKKKLSTLKIQAP